MAKPDDCSLSPEQRAAIREHARRALEAANAIGRYPTSVADVMQAAHVLLAPSEELTEGFLTKIGKKAGGALKRALSKVMGVLDVTARLVYVDRAVHLVKQTFLKLHETAHAVLPWQAPLYGMVQDCARTIAPEVSEQFEREANVFATEVLFQLDGFSLEANAQPFGIKVPLKLSDRYGASLYASIRRYVTGHNKACLVLVLNPPELLQGDGFRAELRRVVCSPSFTEQFGTLSWPDAFTPADEIGAMVPILGRKMSRPRNITLVDANGTRHECVAEAFTQTYQVFILIHAVKTLARFAVLMTAKPRA